MPEGGHHPNRVFIDQSGNLNLNGGQLLDASGNDVAKVVSAPTAGYKIARGEGTFDGSNPTSIETGLTTVIAVVAQLKGTSAPGDNTSVITANINGTAVDYYAWKNTSGTDPTLVASTGTESFYWIAIGT